VVIIKFFLFAGYPGQESNLSCQDGNQSSHQPDHPDSHVSIIFIGCDNGHIKYSYGRTVSKV